ncbi:MAG: Cof-type HAD-IIB family hydrolase [Hydrogenoanaerobacterium sp.]
MKQTMKNILLVSDIDGTICPEFGVFPQRNIDAVKHFTELGGHFTLATGRHFSLVKELVKQFEITTPLILVNGSCIYSFESKSFIYNKYLPKTAEKYLTELSQHSALSLVRIMADDEQLYTTYMQGGAEPDANEYTRRYIKTKSMNEIKHMNWRKVLLIFDPKNGDEFKNFVDSKNYPDVDFVSSSSFYYEMVPKGISKGNGLKMVAEMLNIDIKNTVAVGDYDNDLSMIKAAGLGVASGNAVECVKNAASLIVCNSQDGCLGDVIEYLEKTTQDRRI